MSLCTTFAETFATFSTTGHCLINWFEVEKLCVTSRNGCEVSSKQSRDEREKLKSFSYFFKSVDFFLFPK